MRLLIPADPWLTVSQRQRVVFEQAKRNASQLAEKHPGNCQFAINRTFEHYKNLSRLLGFSISSMKRVERNVFLEASTNAGWDSSAAFNSAISQASRERLSIEIGHSPSAFVSNSTSKKARSSSSLSLSSSTASIRQEFQRKSGYSQENSLAIAKAEFCKVYCTKDQNNEWTQEN